MDALSLIPYGSIHPQRATQAREIVMTDFNKDQNKDLNQPKPTDKPVNPGKDTDQE